MPRSSTATTVRQSQLSHRRGADRIHAQRRRQGELSAVFTFQGFRYARVTIEGKAEITSIASVPISSVSEPTASFISGTPLVNRLVENTIWSQRSNFIEVPTDCPQRDERLGWTGDAQVFAATACYLHDSHDFLRKWLRDVMADQREDGAIPHVVPDPTRLHPDKYPGFYGSTGWGDAICVVPWCSGCTTATARSSRRRCRPWCVGRFRLVDQRRADRPAAARLGRARLHLRRLAAAARGRAKSRCRRSATMRRRRSISTSHRP